MNDIDMTRASLTDIRKMKEAGKLSEPADAYRGEDLGPDFWANAVVVGPKGAKSVHLKLDPEVFRYFYETAGGKGHLTRMQAVLRAYVDAHQKV